MTDAASHTDLSLQAFLAWENNQVQRYERVDGIVCLRSGGTLAEDLIGVNIAAELSSRLRGSCHTVHGSKLKVVSPRGDVFYPYVFVRDGDRNGRATSISDPIVVVEVHSESTSTTDLTRKRLAYMTIPTLKVIVYVSADRLHVDVVRRRPDGHWGDEGPIEDMEGELALPETGVSIPVAEIYARTAVALAA